MAEPARRADPGSRGRLVVKDRVVERLASFAALDVPGVTRHGSGLDRMTGRELPRVHVTVAGGHVRAALDIAVLWPHPLATTAATVREKVTEQLSTLSGLQVDGVDVTVPTIVSARSEAVTRRVE